MIEENKEFIKDYFKAISGVNKTMEMMDKFISNKDFDLKNHIIAFEKAVPRYELLIDDMIAEGDKVAVRFRIKGKHIGEFFGQPGSGAELDFPNQIIYQVQNRKITAHWYMPDTLTMMQQMGAIPPMHMSAG